MKNLLLIIIVSVSYLQGYSQSKNDHEVTYGYRTGISYISHPYISSYQRVYDHGDYLYRSFTKFYNQIFINKTLGKRKKSMLELSIGMNMHKEGHSGENSHIEYIKYKTRFREFVFTPAVMYRYRFAYDRHNNWKHYAGVFISPHIVSDRKSTVFEYPLRNNITSESSHKAIFRKMYYGIEYFGMIERNNRWSIQYSLNYALQHNKYDFNFLPADYTPADPYRHRINANIGIGYRL